MAPKEIDLSGAYKVTIILDPRSPRIDLPEPFGIGRALNDEDGLRLMMEDMLFVGSFGVRVSRISFVAAMVREECNNRPEFEEYVAWARWESAEPEGNKKLKQHTPESYEWWIALLQLVREEKYKTKRED